MADRTNLIWTLVSIGTLAILSVVIWACSDPPPDESRGESGPILLEPQEPVHEYDHTNSGRTLDGSYQLVDPATNAPTRIIVFSSDGAFARVRLDGEVQTSIDLGTYLIDKADTLVLYVEEHDSARYNSARPEICHISGTLDRSFTLTWPDGGTEVYERRDDSSNSDPKLPRIE